MKRWKLYSVILALLFVLVRTAYSQVGLTIVHRLAVDLDVSLNGPYGSLTMNVPVMTANNILSPSTIGTTSLIFAPSNAIVIQNVGITPTLTTSYQTVQDTGAGTIVMGSNIGMINPNEGYIVMNNGWETFNVPTTTTSNTTLNCRYQNQVNGATVPNSIGVAPQYTIVPPSASGTLISVPIPTVGIEKACVTNAGCTGPLVTNDILRITWQCASTPGGALAATGGNMFTEILPWN